MIDPGTAQHSPNAARSPEKLCLRHLAARADPCSGPFGLAWRAGTEQGRLRKPASGNLGFEEFEIERDSLNAEATGSATLTVGTGKYEGISGDLTHTRMLLLPGPKEGVFPGIGTITGSVRF